MLFGMRSDVVVIMTNNEINYINAMKQAKSMLNRNIITVDDYKKIEEKLAFKYSLDKTNLYRSNHLINSSFRVIYMIQKTEVQDGKC